MHRPTAGVEEVEQVTAACGVAGLLNQSSRTRSQHLWDRRPAQFRDVPQRLHLAGGLDDRQDAEELAAQGQQTQFSFGRILAQHFAPRRRSDGKGASAHGPAGQ